jgi:hypothetical protein
LPATTVLPPPRRRQQLPFDQEERPNFQELTAPMAVDFEKGIVWIKWIGTHRDYDRIDVKQVKYEK